MTGAAAETSAHLHRLVTRHAEKHRWRRPANALVSLPRPPRQHCEVLLLSGLHLVVQDFITREEEAGVGTESVRVTDCGMCPTAPPLGQVT